MITRRHFNSSASIAMLGILATKSQYSLARQVDALQHIETIEDRLKDLEVGTKGRLGVYVLDLASGQSFGHRLDDRFMMLSSFKLLASALVLHRVDAGMDTLTRRMPYTQKDIVAWSPITEKHLDGQGLTLAELCEATITTSDNTAGNLILSSFGGPPALTSFIRSLGDNVTRFDRHEPDLNVKDRDGVLDTTSPHAMVQSMERVLVGDVLSSTSRPLLLQWLMGNTTGSARLKAGLPSTWRIGDKTGTNKTDANDIAILFPPNRAPALVAAYIADSPVSNAVKEATLAEVGRLAAEFLDEVGKAV